MDILSNSLHAILQDCPDTSYKSGYGPQFVADIEGHLTLRISKQEVTDWGGTVDNIAEYLHNLQDDLDKERPKEVTTILRWNIDKLGDGNSFYFLNVSPAEFESDTCLGSRADGYDWEE